MTINPFNHKFIKDHKLTNIDLFDIYKADSGEGMNRLLSVIFSTFAFLTLKL